MNQEQINLKIEFIKAVKTVLKKNLPKKPDTLIQNSMMFI